MKSSQQKKKLAFTLSILISILIMYYLPIIDPTIEYDQISRPNTSEANFLWQWSELELLSDTSTQASFKPAISIDGHDNIHIIWYDYTTNLLGSGGDTDIFYRWFNSTTELWSSMELVSTESTENSDFPALDVDIFGTVHVVWIDETDYIGAGIDDDVFYKKKPLGESWTITSVISNESNNSINDVVIDIDDKQNLIVGWSDSTNIGGAGSDYDVFVRMYNKTSALWSSPTLISTESGGISYNVDITIDSQSGDLHCVWMDNSDILGCGSDLDIFYRTWNVETSILSDLEIISTVSLNTSAYPKITLEQNGDVHIVWQDSSTYANSWIDSDIFYTKWNSILDKWDNIQVISTESMGSSFQPSIQCDNSGYIYVAWYDQTELDWLGISDFDIFIKYLNPLSGMWTLTDVVSLESDLISLDPELAMDSLGFISCVWSDKTDFESSGTDDDIIYRRFSGPPPAPILAPIIINPSNPGNITINWNSIQCADDYLLYRSSSFIWTLSGLEPINVVTEPFFTDFLNETGNYYYVVCARNEKGNSLISNVEYIEIFNEEGLIGSFNMRELLILLGIVLALQIIVSFVMYNLGRRSTSEKSKSIKQKR